MPHDTPVIVGNIGNTHSEFAMATGTRLDAAPERIATADLLEGNLPPILQNPCSSQLWLSSVVPQAATLEVFSSANWVSADTAGIDLSALDRSTLGADRIANAAAAIELLELPAVVIDCGTAITVDLIDDQQRFLGGAILPGRQAMRRALSTGTAQLPELALDHPIPPAAGKTTADAMALGIDHGIIGAVEAVCQQITKDIRGTAKVFIAGGDALFFTEHLSNATMVPAYFTLRGVAVIAAR